MKQILIALVSLLSMSATSMNAQSHAASAAKKMTAEIMEKIAEEINQSGALDSGLVAFSDTSDVEIKADSSSLTIRSGNKNIKIGLPDDWFDDDENWTDDDEFISSSGHVRIGKVSELMSTISNLFEGTSVGLFAGSTIAGVLAVAFGLMLLFAIIPILIIAFVLRYVIKRHNAQVNERQDFYEAQGDNLYDRQSTASHAEQMGQTPPPVPPFTGSRPEDLQWKRGVRNTSIGIGLMALFKIMGLSNLVGLGVLIAVLGIGQMVIAKTSK
ncbi:MAG: hypothetical protein IJ196_06970 [Prevotella sp.]|nr:hypothetical protein [Prevotella sp.]